MRLRAGCRLYNFISCLILGLTVMTVMSITGCGGSEPVATDSGSQESAASESVAADEGAESDAGDKEPESEAPEEKSGPVKGARDNTPHVLKPTADGVTAYSDSKVVVDISNATAGYVIIDYEGDNEKPKLQVTGPEGLTYTFDLHGGEETIPLTQGPGSYQVGVFEHIGDGKYAQACSVSVAADISNEYSPYLYPNQFVNFNENSNVVAKGEELAFSADNDLDVVANVYNYMIDNVVYDKELAANVTSGYLPDPDNTLATGKGICFDYAACMASMLRSQQIPTRLEIGYAGDAYHAWISTYIDEVGWINGIVEFNGTDWELMDPTLAASQGEKALKSFIGDGSNYVKAYQY